VDPHGSTAACMAMWTHMDPHGSTRTHVDTWRSKSIWTYAWTHMDPHGSISLHMKRRLLIVVIIPT
jgi:hypothetical protein